MVNPLIPSKPTQIKVQKNNHSAGILDDYAVRKNIDTKEGTITKVPVNSYDIVNKAYVDSVGGVDWTISQAPTVIHADNYTDTNTTYVSSDFTHDDLTGFVANEHIDWTTDQGAVNIHSGNYTNTTYTGGTNLTLTGTEFNVDDAFLINSGNDSTTGTITAAGFTSAAGHLTLTSGNLTDGTNSLTVANAKTAYDHSQDNTQAHSDYLLNSGADSAVGPITITADNSTADQAYVPMVLYNTDATPPAASGFPVGTIYIQYTA